MVINRRPKLPVILFLLFTPVSFSILGATPSSVRALTRFTLHLALHIPGQESWKLGDHVEVQWQGDWYQAEVIEVKGNQFKIHYDGYASSWDEWVDSSRMRAARIKQNNPDTSQQATASSPLSQVLALLKQAYEKQAVGQTDEALSLAESALKIAEKDLGPEHVTVAMSVAALAQLNDQKGDYNRAETFYLRALTLAEKPNSGLEPFFVATLLNGLGRVYYLRGDYLRAEPLYKRALDIQEKSLGPDDLRWRQRLQTWE
jgi:tetratricopeptide (TPR) repeat protein